MLQISQRPLEATSADGALFVGRAAELDKLNRAVRHGFNSLVLGDRGSGKTSLLRQFERQLHDGGYNPVLVETSGADSVRDLVGIIHMATHGRRPDDTDLFMTTSQLTDTIADDLAFLAQPSGETKVILLDSVVNPQLVQHLFGRLRDDIWRLPFVWVVAGNRAERREYLEPPADSFFDAVIELGELNEDEAADLLHRRAQLAGADDPSAEVLLGITRRLAQQVRPRTPRNLLAAAREVLLDAEDDPTKSVTNLYALQRRASQLGRPAAMLFTELMDLGPVSASDRRLLDRLGWTRARAAQVFKQLEDEGLVVVTQSAPSGPGRPRRLYAANSRYHALDDLGDPR